MPTWIRRFLAAPVFEDEDKTRVASLLNSILLSSLAISVMASITVPFVVPKPMIGLAATVILMLPVLAALFLMRRGRVQLASMLFLSMLWMAYTILIFMSGGMVSVFSTFYITATIIAGLLLGGLAMIAFAGLSILAGLGMLYVESIGLSPPPVLLINAGSGWLVLTTDLMMAVAVLYLATRSINDALERARRNERAQAEANRELQAIRASLEQRVAGRTRGLQAAAEVARATTSVLDPDELLRQTVDLARERFDLYYVGLFLLDQERRFAVLRAGTGEAGQQMMAQGHRLEVGGESMIGWCVAQGEARIALDVGEEAVRFDNPLLPETRSEMALPLRSRGQVIGAMTVQSTEEAAFDEADVAVMHSMADLVAVAIDNARLFAETQATLEEMEATQRRYLGQAWTSFPSTRATTRYEHVRSGAVAVSDTMLSETRQAIAQRQTAMLSNGDGEAGGQSALVAPITLRGQPIGALQLHETEGARQWTEDEIALVEAVSEQLALAAENLRLFDETRRRAARERLTREITDNIRAAVTVEDAIQRAVQEMGRALGASEMVARIGTEQDLLSSSRGDVPSSSRGDVPSSSRGDAPSARPEQGRKVSRGGDDHE